MRSQKLTLVQQRYHTYIRAAHHLSMEHITKGSPVCGSYGFSKYKEHLFIFKKCISFGKKDFEKKNFLFTIFF